MSSTKKDFEYTGEMTDTNIQGIFAGAGDFIRRDLKCGKWTLYA